MHSKFPYKYILPLLLFLFTNLQLAFSIQAGVEVVELEEYETVVSYDDNLLGMPYMIRSDDDAGTFLVYDFDQLKVLEINDQIEIVSEYGRTGQGPGEFQAVGNIFIRGEHVYLYDHIRKFIHMYDRAGKIISTLDYGTLVNYQNRIMPLPMAIPDINNTPFVTADGHVLISSRNEKSIYELVDWEGNHLADIGEIPDRSPTWMDK